MPLEEKNAKFLAHFIRETAQIYIGHYKLGLEAKIDLKNKFNHLVFGSKDEDIKNIQNKLIENIVQYTENMDKTLGKEITKYGLDSKSREDIYENSSYAKISDKLDKLVAKKVDKRTLSKIIYDTIMYYISSKKEDLNKNKSSQKDNLEMGEDAARVSISSASSKRTSSTASLSDSENTDGKQNSAVAKSISSFVTVSLHPVDEHTPPSLGDNVVQDEVRASVEKSSLNDSLKPVAQDETITKKTSYLSALKKYIKQNDVIKSAKKLGITEASKIIRPTTVSSKANKSRNPEIV